MANETRPRNGEAALGDNPLPLLCAIPPLGFGPSMSALLTRTHPPSTSHLACSCVCPVPLSRVRLSGMKANPSGSLISDREAVIRSGHRAVGSPMPG
jgi:hypothetical protein